MLTDGCFSSVDGILTLDYRQHHPRDRSLSEVVCIKSGKQPGTSERAPGIMSSGLAGGHLLRDAEPIARGRSDAATARSVTLLQNVRTFPLPP